MQVGLDHIPLTQLFGWDTLTFMEHAASYGYDGVLFPGHELMDPARLERVLELKERLGLYIELGGAGIDSALSGHSPEELVERWMPLFEVARQAGAKVLVTGLGTWPWQGRTQQDPGKSVEAQIEGGIATLTHLKPIAEGHAISVAVHTAFFTADEYVRIMQAVGSPYIGLCLDTANAFLVLEDPIKFAAKVAPWVKCTHLKDSCIYLTDEGMYWLGGSPLGRGTVDLSAIIDLIWQANPEVNLSIEDHWGRSTVPIFDAAFLESLPHWRGESVADLLQHLHRGGALIRAAAHPTLEESQQIDWKRVFPERARYNAAYTRQLRDQVAAKA